MPTLTFDTLQFVQRLKKAGIDETQAEAIAEAVRDVQANADVVTKMVAGCGVRRGVLIRWEIA
ncbi:MAG: CCDC90 family protein [Candidatus Accumulibacter sp.]|jgi:hypothetical protein|nr:CCDC90 family protein [Accumulibacter sp.]